MQYTDCIFASSKYYRKAHSEAQQIAQPLGYDFLYHKRSNNQVKTQKGKLIKKILFDKPLFKQLSNKKTAQNKIKEHLLGEQRKKFTYLSAHPMSLITKTSPQINQQLSQIFMPNINIFIKNTIDFANVLHSVNKQSIYFINDFALSKYIVFYDGENLRNLMHTLNVFDKQFLQYQIVGLTTLNIQNYEREQIYKKFNQSQNLNKIQNISFNHRSNINQKQKINQFIHQIKKKSKQIDLMNQGVHLFIGDIVARVKNYDILKQQIQNLNYLQYYLYMFINGVLADGQNAIIKLRGTIRNKTTDFLYLYRLIFTKISLIKPSFSNFLSNEKYLVCQGFILQNSLQLRQFINQKFDLLTKYGQQRLLVNPQIIFRQQIQGDNTKNFNDNLITKGLKQVLDLYLKNSNIELYPSKTALIERINQFDDKLVFQDILQEIQRNIPTQQDIKNTQNQQLEPPKGYLEGRYNNQSKYGQINSKQIQKQKEIQKQPGQAQEPALDIFAFMRQINKEAKPAPIVEKKEIKPKIDQQQQLAKKLNQKFQQQQRIRQQKKKLKKQQQKKQKSKKDNTYNQSHSYNNSKGFKHFDYSSD